MPVLAFVERMDMVHQCSYSSFSLPQLEELRALRCIPIKPCTALAPSLKAHVLTSAKLPAARSILWCHGNSPAVLYDECCVQRISEMIHEEGGLWQHGMVPRGPVGMAHDALSAPYWDAGNCHGNESIKFALASTEGTASMQRR